MTPRDADTAFRAKLTEGSVAGVLASMTGPMIGGIFSIIAFNLADTYFVGQLGTRELAAISFTFPVVTGLGSLALGLGAGAGSVISRAIGRGDRSRVQRLTTNALILALMIVGVFIAVGLATIDPLFRALGAGPEVVPLIRQYMSVWYWGMGFVVVPMVGNAALRAAGDTKLPSLIMMVAAGVNVVLDPILIFGWWGFPAWGLKGAAVATVIARAMTLAASLWVLHRREGMLLFRLQTRSEMVRSWRAILMVGLPIGATNLIIPVGQGLVLAIVATFGEEVVAGFGVGTRIESFSFIVLYALAASLGPFVGQNAGAERHDRVRRALELSYTFSLAWGAALAAACFFFGRAIAAQFDPDPMVVHAAGLYLMIVPVSYGLEGIVILARAVLNALGNPYRATSLVLSRLFLLYVPLAYAWSGPYGITGVFTAGALSSVAVAFAAAWISIRAISGGQRNRILGSP